jgi:hypothetical protein
MTWTPKLHKYTAAENRARLARLNNGERYTDPRVAENRRPRSRFTRNAWATVIGGSSIPTPTAAAT